MTLDVPDEVRNKVLVDGNDKWLDELPLVVEALSQDWSLRIGATLRGGHLAFVAEATVVDGPAAVLKIGIPGTRRRLSFEATALRLAAGVGCVGLLRADIDRDALLLERLGPTMYDLVPDPAARHDLLCDLAFGEAAHPESAWCRIRRYGESSMPWSRTSHQDEEPAFLSTVL